ncbi:MAG TPA: hypothetical protein V6D31_00485 [Candidatus Sericytochromatia bacterium]|jgi:hypothetical protein
MRNLDKSQLTNQEILKHFSSPERAKDFEPDYNLTYLSITTDMIFNNDREPLKMCVGVARRRHRPTVCSIYKLFVLIYPKEYVLLL